MSTFLNYARDFVDIPYDYWLARFPITNEQYETFAQTQSKNPVSWLKHKRNHPVVNVSWHDAMAYCQWLNDLLREKLPDDLFLGESFNPFIGLYIPPGFKSFQGIQNVVHQ